MQRNLNSQNNYEKEQSQRAKTTSVKVIKVSIIQTVYDIGIKTNQWNRVEQSKNKPTHIHSTGF